MSSKEPMSSQTLTDLYKKAHFKYQNEQNKRKRDSVESVITVITKNFYKGETTVRDNGLFDKSFLFNELETAGFKITSSGDDSFTISWKE